MGNYRFNTLLACSALALSACAGLPGTGGGASQSEFLGAMKEIASDPRCGHIDRISGDLGGLSSGLHVFLERTCPPGPLPAATIDSIITGSGGAFGGGGATVTPK